MLKITIERSHEDSKIFLAHCEHLINFLVEPEAFGLFSTIFITDLIHKKAVKKVENYEYIILDNPKITIEMPNFIIKSGFPKTETIHILQSTVVKYVHVSIDLDI